MKTLELKNTVTEMKNLLNGLSRVGRERMEFVSLRIEQQNLPDWNNREEIDGNNITGMYWTITKGPKFVSVSEKERVSLKDYLKKQWLKTCPDFAPTQKIK